MSAVMDGDVFTFTYNSDGIRTSKTVNGVKHTYNLNGTQIVSEEWGNNIIVYLYDANGAPIGMQYLNTFSDNEIGTVLNAFGVFRNGIFSTILSALVSGVFAK